MAGIEPKYRLVPYVSPSGKVPVQDFLDDLESDDPDAAAAFFDLIAPLVRKYGGALCKQRYGDYRSHNYDPQQRQSSRE